MKISWKILIGRSSIMCLKIHWNVLLIKIRKPKPPPNYEGKQDESITHAKIQSGWKMAWLLQSWEEVEPSEQLSWRKPSGTHGNFNLNCCTFSLEIACEIFLSVADDTTRLRNHCHGRIFNSPGLKSAVTVKGCLIKVATSYKIEVPF